MRVDAPPDEAMVGRMTPQAASNAPMDISTQLSEKRTGFSLERTLMSADRTLLSWVRTSISMIGFGFTIYKVLQYTRQEHLTPRLPLQGPRNFALVFIGLGTLALAVAVFQHWQFVRRIRPRNSPWRFDLSLAVAGVVAMIGILALLDVLFRVGPF